MRGINRLGPGGFFLTGCDSIGRSTFAPDGIVIDDDDGTEGGLGGDDSVPTGGGAGGDAAGIDMATFFGDTMLLASNACFSFIFAAGSGRLVIPGIFLNLTSSTFFSSLLSTEGTSSFAEAVSFDLTGDGLLAAAVVVFVEPFCVNCN